MPSSEADRDRSRRLAEGHRVMKKALAALDEGRETTVQPKNEAEAKKVRDLLPRSVETADDIDELLEALAPSRCGCGADEPCDPYGCGPLVPLPPSRAYPQAEGDAHGLQHPGLQHPERNHYEGPEGHWSENSAYYKCYHTVECPAHEPHSTFEILTGPEADAERDARRAIEQTLSQMPEAAQAFLTDPGRYFRILDTLRKAALPN